MKKSDLMQVCDSRVFRKDGWRYSNRMYLNRINCCGTSALNSGTNCSTPLVQLLFGVRQLLALRINSIHETDLISGGNLMV